MVSRTVTQYHAVSEVAQETIYTTRVNSFFETYTSVIEETGTETLPGTTLTSTSFELALKKRTSGPSATIPAFASPCSGQVRFTSACACIGVSVPNTVTLPAPTQTLTITTTTTYSTLTHTVTAETLATTITDATVSVTNTVATVTVPGPASTTTITVPYPDLCKNIVTYNGLRPVDLSVNLLTNPVGILSVPNCCLRCYVTPGCVAYVLNFNGPGTCLLLSVPASGYPNPPSARCPNGVGATIYGNPPGSVGKGPCDNPSPFNN
ncbi:hypothetical protein TWF730_009161 [Orbilia blumenaviensis]|uniref:Apple domain-containing protein n=1 Tax=Orbilia blumenaviensis TaxID=1796055 RepID=A0AAV9UXI0_9PEZI